MALAVGWRRSKHVFGLIFFLPQAEADYYRTADSALEIRFQAKAGSRLVAVDFLEETAMPEGGLQSTV